jgi:hypothetical protein
VSVLVTVIERGEHVFTVSQHGKIRAWVVDAADGAMREVPVVEALRLIEEGGR